MQGADQYGKYSHDSCCEHAGSCMPPWPPGGRAWWRCSVAGPEPLQP